MIQLRKVERIAQDGSWEEIKFAELKKGDSFRLYDPEDGEPRYEDGSQTYVALTDAVPEPFGQEINYAVQVEL